MGVLYSAGLSCGMHQHLLTSNLFMKHLSEHSQEGNRKWEVRNREIRCCPEPVVVWSPCLSSAATERRICHQRVEKDLLSVILALQRTPICNRTGFCSACPVAHSSLTHLSEAEGKFPFSGGLLHLSSVQHAYFGHGICKTQPGTHKLPVLLHPLQPPTAILRFQSRVRESVARCW